MDHKETQRNPSGIQPGEACYGIYLPAFTPEAMLKPLPGSKGIIRGKAMGSYDCRPKDEDGPACMFLPDEPFENTDIMGSMYSLYSWAIRRSEPEAAALRSSIARKMSAEYAKEIGELQGCI